MVPKQKKHNPRSGWNWHRNWRTPINIISPRMFHLNRVGNGNDDISSEQHFSNSKKSGTVLMYFLLELLLFVQLIEIYLVSQSL
jgi:hypothetical protein